MGRNTLCSHIHFRIAPQEKLILEQAAELVGLKPNTYARQRLIEAAERDLETLRQEQSLLLGEDAWNQLLDIMDKPSYENKKLLRAAARHNKLVS